MKIWKTVIRIWFTVTSLSIFFVGWATLAHAPKPNQFNASDIPSMPRLDPVPSLNQIMFSDQSQNFNQFTQRTQRVRVLRSGGS